MNLTPFDCGFKIENWFCPGIKAGFSKPVLAGNCPADFKNLLAGTGKGAEFSYMEQIHSKKLALALRPGVYRADGLFSRRVNNFLVVKTADCLPLLLAEAANWVGVIHLGWRSARAGILENIPVDLTKSKVFAGPGLRSCCYRVGEEFQNYRSLVPALKRASCGWFFDPVKFAREKLAFLGLQPGNFLDSGFCSYCRGGFFSYRKNKACGRTLSFIGIK